MCDAWIIWSNYHCKWWHTDSGGYSGELLYAGIYTETQAKSVVTREGRNEARKLTDVLDGRSYPPASPGMVASVFTADEYESAMSGPGSGETAECAACGSTEHPTRQPSGATYRLCVGVRECNGRADAGDTAEVPK